MLLLLHRAMEATKHNCLLLNKLPLRQRINRLLKLTELIKRSDLEQRVLRVHVLTQDERVQAEMRSHVHTPVASGVELHLQVAPLFRGDGSPHGVQQVLGQLWVGRFLRFVGRLDDHAVLRVNLGRLAFLGKRFGVAHESAVWVVSGRTDDGDLGHKTAK